MTEEMDEIRKTVAELLKETAAQKERLSTLTKVVKNHEHDTRDGCTKFDVGYL